jgi:hypothetical protein
MSISKPLRHEAGPMEGELRWAPQWNGEEASREALEGSACDGVGELGEHEEATGAFDHGAHGRSIASALDEVGFPVAGDDASGDFWGAQGDGSHVLDACEAS